MSESDNIPIRGTNKLSEESIDELTTQSLDLRYRPIPFPDVAGSSTTRPVWRVRFDLANNPGESFGLDINGEVSFGRDEYESEVMGIDLSAYSAEELGVSRRHLLLRPTGTRLFVLDQGSTNGTRLNGRAIGVNTPYNISDGDTLSLGGLQFIVRVVHRPAGQTGALRVQADLGGALARMARAITSQLELDEVLDQALDIAIGLTSGSEAAIWLVDAESGELFLEAGRGIEDDHIRRLRLPVGDTLAGEVVRSGQPMRASRGPDGELVEILKGYQVEAVVYVPLTLGESTFGVLAVTHSVPGNLFGERDEQLLKAVADFVAIAVQNARLYEATADALVRLDTAYDLEEDLSEADLFGANLREALLVGANLTEADLRGANLQSAWLVEANLQNSDLRLANLQDSYLTRAILNEANLYNADLLGANFYNAKMRGARVTDRQLVQADALRDATMPDGHRYNGRFRLEGEILDASREGINVDDAASMAQFFGVSQEEYEQGQQWADDNLSGLMSPD